MWLLSDGRGGRRRSWSWRRATGTFHDLNGRVGRDAFDQINHAARPVYPNIGSARSPDAEIKWARSLGGPFAATTAIVFPEGDATGIGRRDTRPDAVQVRLHTFQGNLEIVIRSTVVLQQIMQTFIGIAGGKLRSNAILYREVEVTIVVVIAPRPSLCDEG